MSEMTTRVIPDQTSPGSTRSTSGVGELGKLDEKWATAITHRWTRAMDLLECYYTDTQ